ncbi:MAG: aminotransferase class I/II-fold pyridoxal phosphate-dependent enzyme [bacterium]
MRQELAQYFSVDPTQITLYWKGRVALYAILKALDIKAGDEIILPAFTCVVVVNPILYLGAKPVFVDIDPKTHNMDIEKIGSKITPNTRVILAQNTFGLSPDLDEILKIADQYNLTVIEDCTHGFGGSYKGIPNGMIADVSFFSTQWNKPFSTVIGGFAVSKNSDLARKLTEYEAELIRPGLKDELTIKTLFFARKRISSKLYWPAIELYRWLSKNNLILGSSQGDELQKPAMPASFFKGISRSQIAIGTREVEKVTEYIDHRKSIAMEFDRLLLDLQIEPPFQPDYAEHTFLKYPLLVKNREEFFNLAHKDKIELGDWFLSPIHPVISDYDRFNYPYGENPIAEKISQHIINLPTNFHVNDEQLSEIIQFIMRNRDGIYHSYNEMVKSC